MIAIRPLEKEDIESVKEIFDLYWKDDFRTNLSSKLEAYFQHDSTLKEQKFKFFIAEENGEVVGVLAVRKAPEHMKKYATTDNPVEFYVGAVKVQGKGTGNTLITTGIQEAEKDKYTEILFFSGETHKDSWKFHDKYFKRLGPDTAPNSEPGYIWGKVLI